MKRSILLSIGLLCLFLLISCDKINTEVNNNYTSFFITVTNEFTTDITDLTISMVGSEDFKEIDILNLGETTENFEFKLPPPTDDNPVSFGDFDISYNQNNENYNICIQQPETHISVLINDTGFTVEDMTYFIAIKNMSSSLLSNLVISMEGAQETYQIDVLNVNSTSSKFEYHLINSSTVSTNYGCYNGSYTQDENTKPFLLSSGGHNNITLLILDDGIGFSIEDD